MNAIKYLWILLVIPLLVGCSEEMQRNLKAVPTAFGKINEIIVIADQEVWDGDVGDTIRYYYSSAYPLLPQPEPIFDLRHFTPEDLRKDPLRKELRNYFIVGNVDDASSPTAAFLKKDIGVEKLREAKELNKISPIVGKDKWANGQLIVYQYDFSYESLQKAIVKHFPSITRRIHEADKTKIDATVFLDGESRTLMNEIQDKIGVKIRIPKDYFLALSDGDVVWMRKETNVSSSNIIMKKVAYTNESQLSKDGLKSIRDSIGRKYISSTASNTYMRINDTDLPLLTSVTSVNSNYALEARGIWEIVNDYMGGAFVSYLILNPEQNELLFVDGFVHAPGKEKRDYMQHLEHIISTVRF